MKYYVKDLTQGCEMYVCFTMYEVHKKVEELVSQGSDRNLIMISEGVHSR